MLSHLKERKNRGAFFTPPEICRFLVNWSIRSPDDKVLEPSCGDAAFLVAAAERLDAYGSKQQGTLTGVEIDASSVTQARSRLSEAGHEALIVEGSFFDQTPHPIYDVVVGNPPFVRYQQFFGSERAKGLRAALSHGVRLTSLASSWAAFTVHATAFLRESGRLGLVLPAELLSVSYAAEIRRFLLNRFEKVRLIVFENLVFPGVLEEVVLLLAEGKGTSDHFEVYQARDAAALQSLSSPLWQGFTPNDDEKWTPALIPKAALETYREMTSGSFFTTLSDWGETYLGAVTGNNGFFALNASDVTRYGFDKAELLRISPPGARHLRGPSFKKNTWKTLTLEGAKCFLFYPDITHPSKAAKKYIAHGEKLGAHTAYKCRVRSPWWRVPTVSKPDLLFTYMNHDRPRLVSNDAGVHILNSLYGVTLKSERRRLGMTVLPMACLNTVTLLGSEVVGRSYGGGLLKHEPREADLLPVPSTDLLLEAHKEMKLLEPQFADSIRSGNLLPAVEAVDKIILERYSNLRPAQIASLRDARELLFKRRVTRARGSRGSN